MEQKTQELFDDFISVIKETAELVGQIAQVEADKAEAASLRQHHLLDGYIQEEQAQILKLRGLDQKRSRLAQNLGWDSLTFRQILAKAPLRQSGQMRPLFDELEQQLMRLKDSRDAAEQIINVRLHELDVALAGYTAGSYDNAGNVHSGPVLHSPMRDTYV